jgi:hypothetical protein
VNCAPFNHLLGSFLNIASALILRAAIVARVVPNGRYVSGPWRSSTEVSKACVDDFGELRTGVDDQVILGPGLGL